MRLKNNNRNGFDEKYMKLKLILIMAYLLKNIKNLQYKDTYKICFEK